MSKQFNLYNKDKKIGEGRKYSGIKYLVSSLKKYAISKVLFFVPTIPLVLFTGCSFKDNTDELQYKKDTVIEDIQLDNNQRFYRIDNEDGTILFVTGEYLNQHDMVPDETIESRNEFIDNFYKKCEYEYQNKYKDKDFSEFMLEYPKYKKLYDAFMSSDNKEAYYSLRYMTKDQERIIKLIESYDTEYGYIPMAIPYKQFVERNYGPEEMTLEYKWKPGDTANGIADAVANNNKQYNEIKEAMNLENPDRVLVGDKVTLPHIEQNDLDVLGYTNEPVYPKEELAYRIEFLRQWKDRIKTLPGDKEALKLSSQTQSDVYECIGEYNNMFHPEGTQITDEETQLLYKSRGVCDKIELLSGIKFKVYPHDKDEVTPEFIDDLYENGNTSIVIDEDGFVKVFVDPNSGDESSSKGKNK